MSDITAILQAGEILGLKGEDLKTFIMEQQDEARDLRALEREKLKKQQEHHEFEIQKMKEQQAIEREQQNRINDLEREKMQLEREKLKIEEEKMKIENHKETGKTLSMMKLPVFEDSKDKLDTYISRFESVARMQNWRKEEWAIQLSILLTGDALETFYSLPDTDQTDYEKVKEALLRKYSLTEEEFRAQFYETTTVNGETTQQFMARIERLFTKWIDAAKVEKTYKGLSNLIIREGFYKRCNPELKAYLREKNLTELGEIVTSAQRYVDAHKCEWDQKVTTKSRSRSVEKKKAAKLECTICKRQGHTDEQCWFKDNDTSSAEKKCFRCGSSEHLVKDCKQEKESVGSSSVLTTKHTSVIQDRYKHLSAEALGKTLTVPVSEGKVNGYTVMVMRDTGFAGAAVRSSFVRNEDYLEEYEDVYLLDSTHRRFQKAMVKIETKYYTGTMKVLVVDTLVLECVIGNVIEKEPQNENQGDVNQREDVIATVVTRSEARLKGKSNDPLVVHESELADRTTFIELQKADPSLMKYWDLVEEEEMQQRHGKVHFEVKKDLLHRVFAPNVGGNTVKQIVVPEKMREKVISVAHDGMLSGHCGMKRTKERVISNFFWKDIDQDVRRFCRSCNICQKTMQKGRQGKAPLQRMPVIGEPFRRVAVDLVGPIVPCSERSHKYILTVVDYATRYPEAESLKTIDAISVAEALINIFCRIGFPEEMLSDKGTQFMSDVMKEVNRLLSIKHLNTTAWHPQCNGLVERFNGTLKTILKRLCAECPKQWDRFLPAVLFAYRTSVQESSGFSPFELVFGRKVRGPMEILKAYWGREKEEDVKNVYKYVVDLKQRLQETSRIAQEELIKAQEQNKKQYDKSARPKSLKAGQKVLLLLPTKANKLLLQWRGPYKVIEKTSPVNYVIQIGAKTKTFHVNMLKQYIERRTINENESKHRDSEESRDEGENTTDVDEEDRITGVGQEDVDEDQSDQEARKTDKDNNAEMDRTYKAETHTIASSVLKDGDAEDLELIEVCPLSSIQSWEDVSINPQLTDKQKLEVKKLLQEESDVLTNLPGCTTVEKHVITLTTDEPVRAKLYPIPYTQRQVIAQEVQEMMKMNIIRPSKSPYAAPPVLVKKPDGTVRFCVNFKKLNKVTVFDGEPIPCPDDVYAELRGQKYRTKMDLTKGYWQISVQAESVEKTTFVTPDGVYEFLRMPFGLKNSAASFNRVMRRVLGKMEGVGCFVDDIMIYTDSWDEHMSVLRKVFSKLRNAGLTVKPSKCTIGVTEVEFVGHKVGIDTLQPREEKIDDVLNVQVPKTRRQVKSFLAMAGYYAKFVKNFSDITFPLTELTKEKPSKFHWGEREEFAFQEIKQMLSKNPILRIVNFVKTMYIQTDASDVGLGAVLLQEHEGLLHPVRYLSRKLKPAERNYSTVEREGLGVVWTIEKLRVFLYGCEFVLLVDHKPLTFINNTQFLNNRVMLFLQDYSFKVESIKGVDNLLADYLSRV